MIGMAGAAGNPKAKDPVDRVSCRVQAVACFFPPTDFLNWGKPGDVLDSKNMDRRFKAAIDFQNSTRKERIFQRVTDEKKVQGILREISPISHVSRDDPPTLIIHGDKDQLVPLQQSRADGCQTQGGRRTGQPHRQEGLRPWLDHHPQGHGYARRLVRSVSEK